MNQSIKQHTSLLQSLRAFSLSKSYKYLVPPGVFAAALIFSLLALVNCQTRKIEPVAIAAEDMCSYCRMAISEKRVAAELIDSESQAFKFDDIGCMVNFVKNQKNSAKTVAYFVMDFENREWVKAESAFFVRSNEIRTPMNGGIIAFKDRAKAQAAADKYHGTLVRFDTIIQ